MTIYEKMKATGVKIDHHESDLYIEVTPETEAIVNDYEHKGNVTRFISNVDGKQMFDIPFSYDPYWDKKKTFWFNTGVRPESVSPLFGRQVWKNGTKQIPFTCNDVPDNAVFLFACDDENMPESKSPGVIVRRILDNGPKGILSKFAYFRIGG